MLFDPQGLAGYGIDLSDLRRALQAGNHIRDDISVTAENRELLVQAGTFLTSAEEIGSLVVGVHEGKPVYLRDVASVSHESDLPGQYVWLSTGPERGSKGLPEAGNFPSVTIAVAKRAGTNSVVSTLVAEVYGLDYRGQTEAAWEIRQVFENTPDIVDIDDSVEHPSAKFVVWVDRAKAARLGVAQSSVAEALATVLKGEDSSAG